MARHSTAKHWAAAAPDRAQRADAANEGLAWFGPTGRTGRAGSYSACRIRPAAPAPGCGATRSLCRHGNGESDRAQVDFRGSHGAIEARPVRRVGSLSPWAFVVLLERGRAAHRPDDGSPGARCFRAKDGSLTASQPGAAHERSRPQPACGPNNDQQGDRGSHRQGAHERAGGQGYKQRLNFQPLLRSPVQMGRRGGWRCSTCSSRSHIHLWLSDPSLNVIRSKHDFHPLCQRLGFLALWGPGWPMI